MLRTIGPLESTAGLVERGECGSAPLGTRAQRGDVLRAGVNLLLLWVRRAALLCVSGGSTVRQGGTLLIFLTFCLFSCFSPPSFLMCSLVSCRTKPCIEMRAGCVLLNALG